MKPKGVLDAAAARLTEEKVETGGPHEATFLMIARLWTAYLKAPVPPRGVAVMMAMLKASRVKCAPYPFDGNFVDMAGYAGRRSTACGIPQYTKPPICSFPIIPALRFMAAGPVAANGTTS